MIAKSRENSKKRILVMQREQRARLAVQRFERIAALERRNFEHAFASFDQVEQQLGMPVALPVAGEATEAAKAATPKRKTGEAITTEFETLDASQAGDREVSSNGHGTFRRQH